MSRDPVPIGDSLGSVIRSLRDEAPKAPSPGGTADGTGAVPAPTATQMGAVFGRWAEVVGDAVAAHVTPIKLDGTRLVVEVDDPAWATQLRFLEASVKQRVLEVAGALVETIEARVKRY